MFKLCKNKKLSTLALRFYLLPVSWETRVKSSVPLVAMSEGDKNWS